MRLIGDIGGTNARFALAENGVLREPTIQVLKTSAYASLLDAIRAYLSAQKKSLQNVSSPKESSPALHKESLNRIDSVRLAIAGPVSGDWIAMTNAAWHFSVQQLIAELRAEILPALQTLHVINDFEAQALAVPHLQAGQMINIGELPARAGCKSVIGPGTGFGAASLIPVDNNFVVLPGEGGHASIGPADDRELAVLQWLLQRGLACTREELLSGPGLERLFLALADINQRHTPKLPANEIVDAATAGDTLAKETLATFCALLGTAARDQALICGAHGGIYISGGIVMHFVDTFLQSEFRARFETSATMADYLRDIPTYLITTPFAGLIGAANAE